VLQYRIDHSFVIIGILMASPTIKTICYHTMRCNDIQITTTGMYSEVTIHKNISMYCKAYVLRYVYIH
jgi:hypothetical protein